MEIRQRPDGKAEVYTPYDAEFVCEIKTIGGARWDKEKRCWTVSVDKVETVRKIMRDVYGEDDTPKPPSSYFDRAALEAEKRFLEDRIAEINGILFMLEYTKDLNP